MKTDYIIADFGEMNSATMNAEKRNGAVMPDSGLLMSLGPLAGESGTGAEVYATFQDETWNDGGISYHGDVQRTGGEEC